MYLLLYNFSYYKKLLLFLFNWVWWCSKWAWMKQKEVIHMYNFLTLSPPPNLHSSFKFSSKITHFHMPTLWTVLPNSWSLEWGRLPKDLRAPFLNFKVRLGNYESCHFFLSHLYPNFLKWMYLKTSEFLWPSNIKDNFLYTAKILDCQVFFFVIHVFQYI